MVRGIGGLGPGDAPRRSPDATRVRKTGDTAPDSELLFSKHAAITPLPGMRSPSEELAARLAAATIRDYKESSPPTGPPGAREANESPGVAQTPVLVPSHLAQLGERKRESVRRFFEVIRKLGHQAGGITRPVVIAALGASVGAPVVAAAFTSWGAAAAATLNQLSAFGAGYLTNLVSDWLKRNPQANSNDEETVRQALCEILLALDEITIEASADDSTNASRRHLALLLADPQIIGAIISIAATEGRNLVAFRPSASELAMLGNPSDDDWLYEEIIEALEDLARSPIELQFVLERVYRDLCNEE